MAYAELAGLPAITGLYTTILCLVGYAVFGPSRILVLGPDSSLGPMIAATILPILGSNGSPERAIALASMLALLVGVIMIGRREARVRRRPAVQADADRLHERSGANDPDRAVAQTVWLFR
jgi:MFS superfamily sulfate permease-like transporter